MSVELILVLGGLTYLSRAGALVFLPRLPSAVSTALDRVPAPLFAGLAALSLVEGDGPASLPVLTAAAAALVAARTRSMLWILAAGLAGYALGVIASTAA